MDYQRHYNHLIERAKERTLTIFTETHHIIPVCMGGNNNRSNLVELTPEEHYVAHLLLVKIYPTVDELIFAAHRMCSGQSRNNKLYGWVRREHAEAMSRLHKGKIMSEESRKKMSESRKGKKHTPESIEKMCLSQQNRSKETRQNISKSHMGHIVTEETKQKLRDANIGKIHTEETKKKMSDSRSGEKNHFYGKQHSKETRQKMRESAKNRKKPA